MMKALELYRVTKSSTDQNFKVGDIIWLSENRDLNNAMAGGWLSKHKQDIGGTNDFEYKVCDDYYLDIYNNKECIRKRE